MTTFIGSGLCPCQLYTCDMFLNNNNLYIFLLLFLSFWHLYIQMFFFFGKLYCISFRHISNEHKILHTLRHSHANIHILALSTHIWLSYPFLFDILCATHCLTKYSLIANLFTMETKRYFIKLNMSVVINGGGGGECYVLCIIVVVFHKHFSFLGKIWQVDVHYIWQEVELLIYIT